MADAVVNFMVQNLLQLLSDNVALISGAEENFRDLLEEVKRLEAFLRDAVKMQGDSSQWDQLVKEIQSTVFSAEDVIDKFLAQAKVHQDKSKVGKFIDVNHIRMLKKLATKINNIHKKVKKLREINQAAFQPQRVLELPPKKSIQDAGQGPAMEAEEVVGFDEEAKKVTKQLVGVSTDLKIVPVVGMPGLGKTTLARKIFNDPDLAYEFFSILWVYVGRSYKVKDVYLNILKHFTKQAEDYDSEDVDGLAKVIGGFMGKGGRCLIVLDDVWDTEVIDVVKNVFIENNKGHRIMMTTRERRLGKYASASEEPHDLKFLTEEESFELLVKRVFGKGSCPHALVGLGKKIAVNCGGVPLAVVVVAGALKGRPDNDDWMRVEKNVAQHLYMKNTDNSKSCLKFVEMSYERLPEEVQTCFLYCGIYPRGFDIPSWKLIRLWIAEGLIKPQSKYTVEEIAEFYLKDLVSRNLVISMKRRSDGQIKTCRLHDMLHEFCRNESSSKCHFQEIAATAEGTVATIQGPETCRRLCVQHSVLDAFLSTKPVAEHVRSFYCFASKQKQIEVSPSNVKLIHKAFPLIRVLDVEQLNFLFSKEFNQLFHLRYAAISGDFKALPPFFGKFWNLQTLILNTSTSEPTLEVKGDIWNMLQLRHLHTNIPAKLPSPASMTGRASSLQTLSMVAPESCKKEVLAKACHLRKLSIRGQMAAFLENKGGISNLEELKCLEHLKLLNDVLYMNKTVHLPLSFSRLVRTMRKLTLANTRFVWSEADRLGQCEALEVLKLKENAYTGDSWKPSIGGFSALQVLWIERAEFQTWEASNQNFPILRNLVLISCDKLNDVPLGLANIPSLQEMRLETTNKAVKSAKEIMKIKATIPESSKLKLTIFPPEADSKAPQ